MIVCSSGPVTAAVGTQHRACHLTAAGARCRSWGANPRWCRRSVPAMSVVSSAWRYKTTRGRGPPGEGCGGRGVLASGCCLTSVTPVCQQLISSPAARPLGFVVGFDFFGYFLYYFHLRAREQHTPSDTGTHSSALCTPTTSWGVPPSPFSLIVGTCPVFLATVLPPKPSDASERCELLPGKPPLPAQPHQGRPDPAPQTSSPAALYVDIWALGCVLFNCHPKTATPKPHGRWGRGTTGQPRPLIQVRGCGFRVYVRFILGIFFPSMG